MRAGDFFTEESLDPHRFFYNGDPDFLIRFDIYYMMIALINYTTEESLDKIIKIMKEVKQELLKDGT